MKLDGEATMYFRLQTSKKLLRSFVFRQLFFKASSR